MSIPGSNVVPSEYIHKDEHPKESSFETTAAKSQAAAANPIIAEDINKYATGEQRAAEDAARVAQELGPNFTGKPSGDTDDAKVRDAMETTSVEIGQVHTEESKAAESKPPSAQAQEAPHPHHVPGRGIMSSMQESASAAMDKTGRYYQSAKGSAESHIARAVETVEGYMGIGPKHAAGEATGGKEGAQATGKGSEHDVKHPQSTTTSKVGGGAGASEERTATSHN